MAAADLDALRDAVLEWYGEVARELPWRATRDPYAILVSEVMLQQTQVARVVERYLRWLERWPDVHALAGAAPAEVLAEWSGLGYNSRALRLRQAAIAVATDGWPRTAVGLRALPGVGPYTAAAVASFAFDEPVAAVDVNVARVAARIGRGAPHELLAADRAATWNQAAMELGATVCRARSAACEGCPAARWCASRGAVTVAPRGSGAPRERFEDSRRWVRGRVVAALAAGQGVPDDIPAERLAPALAGLERDGLLVRDATGWRLPVVLD
jgi:A/G-specific adenine glycosylase